MNDKTVLVITSLGKALLEKPQGRITGDARLLMGLIDGSASNEEIAEKVPPSVRVKLPEIFARLLNYGVVEEKGRGESGAALKKPAQISEVPHQQATPSGVRATASDSESKAAEIENERRIELERARVVRALGTHEELMAALRRVAHG
jgi:hypothetical protein